VISFIGLASWRRLARGEECECARRWRSGPRVLQPDTTADRVPEGRIGHQKCEKPLENQGFMVVGISTVWRSNQLSYTHQRLISQGLTTVVGIDFY
jgi:hypothetical protein